MDSLNPDGVQAAAAEAATRQHTFSAKERAEYVRAMVKRCEAYKADGLTIAAITERLPEFARDYPKLFESVLGDEPYHKNTLQTMLAMLERMGQGSLNHHQATVIVGQRLAQKYIHKDGEQK
jgi:16S rRNA G966 N2-methylase RsmD